MYSCWIKVLIPFTKINKYIIVFNCLQWKVNTVLQFSQNRNHVNIKENMNLHWTKKPQGKQGTSHFRSRLCAIAFWHVYLRAPVYPEHIISPISILFPISLSVSHYPSEKQWPLSSHPQFVCMYSKVFLRMHICAQVSYKSFSDKQSSLHNAVRRSQWCHLHLHWNPAHQHDLQESYYKWFINIGFPVDS